MEAEQKQQKRNIVADGQPPVLTAQANVDGSIALIFGSTVDTIGVQELLIDGLPVQLSTDGLFEPSLYVPEMASRLRCLT